MYQLHNHIGILPEVWHQSICNNQWFYLVLLCDDHLFPAIQQNQEVEENIVPAQTDSRQDG